MDNHKKNQERIDAYDYLTKAASTQDCTGLIPSAPANQAELDSYAELCHYEPPKIKSMTKDETHQQK